MSKKQKENYLDFVPRPNRLFETSVNEAGHVEILTEHRGFYNKIAQKVFKKPRFSHIELDDFGTFIWNQMDGKKSIYEIGADVRNQFGEKAEPLYERLSKFMKILHDQHYIVYENKLTADTKKQK
jgi:glutathionyl-hydroquinone reductase